MEEVEKLGAEYPIEKDKVKYLKDFLMCNFVIFLKTRNLNQKTLP